MGALDALISGDYRSIECKSEVCEEYTQRTQAELRTMVWSHPSISYSWFRNPSGEIYILSPWRLVDYWNWTKEPNLSEFLLQH
jgi:4-hydroxyacetophenone monooxygenase